MFDLGWSELLIVAIAALIIVGPKDLPRMLRTLGQYAARAKSVAREFQRSMDEAARQADIDELREVKKDLDTDVTGLRDSQYQMQREMSQSFMDKPGKKSEKKGEETARSEGGGEAGTKGDGKAAPGEAKSEAPETAEPPAPEPTETPPEAEPRPRKASGA